VGWIRSYIREAAQRELLFDLDTLRASLKETGGAEMQRTLLNKSISNLVRMWGDDLK
jgi:PKHD-type hydroxylase